MAGLQSQIGMSKPQLTVRLHTQSNVEGRLLLVNVETPKRRCRHRIMPTRTTSLPSTKSISSSWKLYRFRRWELRRVSENRKLIKTY